MNDSKTGKAVSEDSFVPMENGKCSDQWINDHATASKKSRTICNARTSSTIIQDLCTSKMEIGNLNKTTEVSMDHSLNTVWNKFNLDLNCSTDARAESSAGDLFASELVTETALLYAARDQAAKTGSTENHLTSMNAVWHVLQVER